MNASDLASDGACIARTLLSPGAGLAAAVERRRSLTALVLSTLAALAFAAVAAPRVDWERAAAARLDRTPKGAELSPHDREQALATARKVGELGVWAGAAAGPAAAALGAAALLFLGFRVAGASPSFRDTFAVAAHGLVPIWLGRVLAIPAAVARAPLRPEELDSLLPSSAAALLPAGAPPPLAAALGALDLFALWAVALVAAGMARASGASARRAAAVAIALWIAFVAVARVALPALLADGPRPGGGP